MTRHTIACLLIVMCVSWSSKVCAKSANLKDMAYLSKTIVYSYADSTEIFFQTSKRVDNVRILPWRNGFTLEASNTYINKDSPRIEHINDGIINQVRLLQYQTDVVRMLVQTNSKISIDDVSTTNTESPYGLLVKVKTATGSYVVSNVSKISNTQSITKTPYETDNIPAKKKELYDPPRPDFYSERWMVLRMIFALGVVIGTILISYYLLKRYSQQSTKVKTVKNLVKVITKVSIAPKQWICIVEVLGTYLVLGLSNNTFTCLTEIKDEKATMQLQALLQKPGFSRQLSSLTGKLHGLNGHQTNEALKVIREKVREINRYREIK